MHGYSQRLEFFPLRAIKVHGKGRNTNEDMKCSKAIAKHEEHKPKKPNAIAKCQGHNHSCCIVNKERRLVRGGPGFKKPGSGAAEPACKHAFSYEMRKEQCNERYNGENVSDETKRKIMTFSPSYVLAKLMT